MKARPRTITILCAILLGSFAPSLAADTEAREPSLWIGYDFSGLDGATPMRPSPIGDPVASASNPLFLRLEVLWGEVERRAGEYDWSAVDAIVDRFRARGHELVLDLWGGTPVYSDDILRPPKASETAAMEAWERFVRDAARHFKGRIRYFQIGKTPDSAAIWGSVDSVRSYAFLVKKAAPIVRAEVKESVIVSGGLAGPDTVWLQKLYKEGTAPYLDVISFRADAREAVGDQCEKVLAAIREGDASDGLWVEAIPVVGTGEEAGRDIVRKLLTVLDHEASAAFFALPYAGDAGTPIGGEFLVRSHSALRAGTGRVPSSDRVAFLDAAGSPLGGLHVVSFYEPKDGVAVTGYWAEREPAPVSATVRITARHPGPPTIYDPITGQQSQPAFAPDSGGVKGDVPLSTSPLFLVYREGTAGRPEAGEKESLEVTAVRGITADEVIAKYREFQAAQDARFTHDLSDAMITFHFRLAGSSRTIDIGMAGTYFFDPKGMGEWELTEYYLNGNRSRWKEFPELPLIQPEKVLTLPLDITFDRSYTYEYAGEDTVDGRACHVLSFEPVDPERTLYRGKVWIDKALWARVRVASIQTKLEPPFLSSEEKTTYAPVAGPDGADIWVVSRVDGQQIYSASGRNFIVLREIVFRNHKINDPDFDARRSQAHASSHQMLRDTDKGLRYLDKDETGERKVKENFDTNQFFGLAGVVYDPSLETPVPLLGVNYFDYDFRKTGIQTNLFFAGVLATLNATNPNVFKSGFDLGADLFLSALSRTDRDFREGGEVEERALKRREQSIAFNLGREIGNFVKLRSSYELSYLAYDEGDDTDESFVLPKDTLIHTASLSGSFNRGGYEVRASGSYAVRKRFGFWGGPCQIYNPDPPRFCAGATPRARERRARIEGDDFLPEAKGFTRYEAGAAKEFFLPTFQKLRFAVDLYGGSDLDRFSRYAFDRFGAPVRGFAGSGIRFDEGGILRAGYHFNVASLIRLEATIDQARVKRKGRDSETTNHTGIGFSANVLGPWKTVWQLEYGYALRSDVKPVEGDQEVLLVILKLF